jgi:hypothetical protein
LWEQEISLGEVKKRRKGTPGFVNATEVLYKMIEGKEVRIKTAG